MKSRCQENGIYQIEYATGCAVVVVVYLIAKTCNFRYLQLLLIIDR